MSTKIRYNGSEIASFSNDTKTLKCEGKVMASDITVTDTGGGGAEVTIEENEFGGLTLTIEGA